MVLKSDAIPAGEITRWEWYAAIGTGSIPQAVLSDFRIKMCHTSRNVLGTPFASNYEGRTPTLVYYADPEVINPPVNTWFGWDFAPTFRYNGADNLLVETWWEGGNNGGPNCWASIVPNSKRAVVASIVHSEPQNGYPNGGAVKDYNFYMRITLESVGVSASSFGRVKALFR